MENKILIIEDESDIQNILRYSFMKEKFKVRCASCGIDGIEICEDFSPDIIMLDLMLPDISGFEVCKRLTKYNIPIIMLTARNDIVDKVLGLELGADDYITKPFDIRECIARVNVALRRVQKNKSMHEYIDKEEKLTEITIDNIKIVKNSRKVFIDNTEVKLKPKEMSLLIYLIDNKNIAVSREQIMDKVWGDDYDGDFRTVDVHIRRLRQKLNNKDIIETIFGIGYMLKG